MKICLIGDVRLVHTQRWAQYFAKNHEVHLITYDKSPKDIDGVIEHVVKGPFNQLYLDFIPRQIQIQRLIKQINPDIVHAHFIAKYGFHLPSNRKYPTFLSAWGDDVLILPQKSRLIYYFTKKALIRADKIYSVSHDITKHIISDFGISDEKIRDLPFGIDTSLFYPKADYCGSIKEDEISTKSVTIFSNRGFYPVYDTITLIKAFEILFHNNPSLKLVLRGDGPLIEDAIRYTKEHDLSDSINFYPRVEYEKVPLDYRNYDIYVNTSISDGTPVTLLEAMCSAIPIITTGVGGIPEWIEDEVNGLLVPVSSPKILAEKIEYLINNPQIGKVLAKNAREKVLQNGNWWSLMKSAEDDYLMMLKK